MPPPPVTPSPHRFLVKKGKEPVRRTPLAYSQSVQHFNSTPRFTFPSTPRPTASQIPSRSSPSVPQFSTPGIKREKDVIEDLSSDDQPYNLQESIEHDGDDFESEIEHRREQIVENGYESDIEENTPKRRRLSTPMLLDEELHTESHQGFPKVKPTSSLPSLPSPHSKRPTTSQYNAHHKFQLNTPGPAATPQPIPTPEKTAFIKPPRFVAPEPSESAGNDPLPDQFSPHRKGQKYVPGGMAAELRDWLTNISSSIPPRADKSDPWLIRIMVDEVTGGTREGMTMIRGRQVHDRGAVVDNLGFVRCVLAGEGMSIGLQKSPRIEAGKVVGVKGPVWEMTVEGQRWGVGVEWKVLS